MTHYAKGDSLPAFTMETPEGGTLTRDDLSGQRCVLFFYPKDNTPGCTAEAKDFSALKNEFDAAGVRVIGISKDSPQKHRNFIAKHDLKLELATDAAEDGLSDTLGIWTEKQMYGRTYMGMVRSTYLLDEQGRILRIWPKVSVKGHAAEVLDEARA